VAPILLKQFHFATSLFYFSSSLYTQQWTDRLKFKEGPKVGTICVALFSIDHCWYRAKILKEKPNNRYEVSLEVVCFSKLNTL